jgi:acyl-CoA synthetase (AMP-forming)/AMP-acid ligase II/acyl carrier protein
VVEKLVEEGIDWSRVGILNMAGEPLSVSLVDKLPLDNLVVYNLYGPSEDTTYSTYYQVRSNDHTTIPIGRPISNTRLYILDDYQQLVPRGVSGKIYLSGDGLSKGYLNKEELTQEKFVTNPYETDSLMYDTGDLGRWLPNGEVEYLGRKDNQVKIRGYRIELGEIETVISRSEIGIRQVVVEPKGAQGEKVLVAYCVMETEDQELDKVSLRSYLQGMLPEYMVPTYFMELEKLPLTPNGKIDRKLLPEITSEDKIRNLYIEPRNETETRLVEIWEQLLNVEKVGVLDHFFDLGGHSLIATKLINVIHKEFNVKVTIQELFKKLTLEELASYIDNLLLLNAINQSSELVEEETDIFSI